MYEDDVMKHSWSCMLHTCVSKGYMRRSKSQLNLTKYSLVMMILVSVLSCKIVDSVAGK